MGDLSNLTIGTYELEDTFCIAALDMHRRAGTGLMSDEIVRAYGQSREALQGQGYSENEIDAIEREYVGTKTVQKVMVQSW